MRILPLRHYLPTVKGLMGNWVCRQRKYPLYASFKLTSRCTSNCSFCNMRVNQTKELSTEDIKKILDNLSRSSVLMVSFEGGEPLLRKDIFELLSYARTKQFYLLFTTSIKEIFSVSSRKYLEMIDFLHISIDEGHRNLELFSLLPDIVKFHPHVSVQSVVTQDTLTSLESKVRQCHENGVNIVIIPATPLDETVKSFPDDRMLNKLVGELKVRYPNTVHTPSGYFDSYRKKECSPLSVVISPDGYLYYPCHILNSKGPNLTNTDLNRWLSSDDAKEKRIIMKNCSKNCGWYQYYSISSYTSITGLYDTLKPVLFQQRRGNG